MVKSIVMPYAFNWAFLDLIQVIRPIIKSFSSGLLDLITPTIFSFLNLVIDEIYWTKLQLQN